jgi:hypothetical protein
MVNEAKGDNLMKAFAFLPVFFLVLYTLATGEDDASVAKRILERYMDMPQTQEAYQARQSVLAELKATPKGAVSAAEQVLFERANPKQRLEIVGLLGELFQFINIISHGIDEHLSMMSDGRVLYRLKRQWRDGTTHVLFEPLEPVAKLAALVPPPGLIL